MGIGMCLVTSPDQAFDIQRSAEKAGQPTYIIGEITASEKVRVLP
jgi:phosphoribosylaminoimidazole (AIR) synthetase